MSHISSSRMPHAYAAPEQDGQEHASLGDSVRNEAAKARAAVGKVSAGSWLLCVLGAGVTGAALYAAFGRPAAASKRRTGKSGGSKPRRAKAAN